MTTCQSSNRRVGIALLLLSVVTYSTAGLFTKGVGAGAWEIIFWRGLFSAAFASVWTFRQRRFQREFFGMGTCGWAVAVIGGLGQAAFIPAFKLTTIANVALIYAVAPLIAALLAWLVMRERASAGTLIGCLFALAGVAVIVSGSLGHGSLTGDALALCMTIAMASVMVIYRKYPDTPGAGPAAMQSVLLLPVALLLGDPFSVVGPEIVVLAAFGLLFAIASIALAEGAKRLPAGQTALLSTLETPLAPVLAFLVLAEIPTFPTFIGGALVLFAVWFSVRQTG